MKNFGLFVVAYVAVIVTAPPVVAANALRKLWHGESLSAYFKTAAIGFDQAGGSVLYAQENFTVSSYTYYLCRHKKNRYACAFMRFIDAIFGKDHCRRSYEWERQKDRDDLNKFDEG